MMMFFIIYKDLKLTETKYWKQVQIINVIILISYRIISYIILLSINYIPFNAKILFAGIYNALLINIIYGIILHIIVDLLAKILNKKRVE